MGSMADHHIRTMLRMLESMHEEFKDISRRVAACEEHVESRIQQTRRLDGHEKQLEDLVRKVRQVQQLIPAIISTERGRRMAIERLRSHVEGESSGLQEQEVMQAALVDMLGDAHSNLPSTLPELPEGSVNFWQAQYREDTTEAAEERDQSADWSTFKDLGCCPSRLVGETHAPLDVTSESEVVKERTLTLTLTSCGSDESIENRPSTDGLQKPSEEGSIQADGDESGLHPSTRSDDATSDPCVEADPEVRQKRFLFDRKNATFKLNYRDSRVSRPSAYSSGGQSVASLQMPKMSAYSSSGTGIEKMISFTPIPRVRTQRVSGVAGILSELRAIVEGEIFGTHPAVKEIFESANTVRLKESVWDASLFLLYSPLGRGTNCTVLVPVILTMFLQMSFTGVVSLFIVNSETSPLMFQSDFQTWFNDADTDVVTAVCSGDASLTSSFLQASTFDIYNTYSGTIFGGGHGLHSAGPFTCFLVCCAWILTVLQEFGQVMDKLLGVWNTTDRSVQVMELQIFQTSNSSGFSILAIPPHRAAWFIFITSVECVVAVFLLIAGIRWLVSTTEIVELLLNGVALSYIMDLDELIYNVFIPMKLSTLMALLEPLPANWPMIVPVRSLVLAVGCVGIIVTSLVLILSQLEDAVIVRDTLCPLSSQ